MQRLRKRNKGGHTESHEFLEISGSLLNHSKDAMVSFTIVA